MCYNVAQLKRKQVKYANKVLNIKDDALINDYYSVSGFVHPNLYAITNQNPENISILKWGLIPSWVKDEAKASEIATYTLNAKSETIFDKPSFKSVGSKRCLIPINGFYEWQLVNKKKYPYFIYPRIDEQFMVGGIFDMWLNKQTGEEILSFSLVTTAANASMEFIHNQKKRMPLILDNNEQELWLNNNATKEDLIAIMKPCSDDLLKYHTVSKLITDRTRNSNVDEVMEVFVYDELM